MSKVNKIDKPGYRGKVRQCPSCDGLEVVGKFRREKVCETCLRHGIVYQGVFCQFCGRSPQVEYKGLLICGTKICKDEADKKAIGTRSMGMDDDSLAAYQNMFGLT
jgi:hypothetical protein